MARITQQSSIHTTGTSYENEPIVKSDGAGEVMQWMPSDGTANGVFVREQGNVLNLGIGVQTPGSMLSVSPIRYNTGTASQSGTTVTGSGTTWTAAMVGGQFVYADGTTSGAITARASNTSITVTTSQTVASQAYGIHYTGLQVSSAGNVGVGIALPTSAYDRTVHINNSGGSGSSLHLTDSTSGSANGDGFELASYAGDAYVLNREGSNLYLGTSGATKLTIDSAGNVGVGATPESWHSSYTALQFAGNGALSGWGNQQAGAAVFLSQNAYLDPTDWKYISTDEASRYEQVNGTHTFSVATSDTEDTAITWTDALTISSAGAVSIPATGSFTVGSLEIGHGAGGGDTNTAIGTDALDATHASSTDNTAVGHDALTAVNGSTAHYNTAVGSGAGKTIETGQNNTALGAFAFDGAVVGALRNTAVGQQALSGAAVNDNVAVGNNALLAFSGSNATAVGSGAADAATDATNLTAVGYSALGGCIGGLENTAVGYNAGLAITTGDYNTAMGSLALDGSNVDAYGNTAFGRAALGGACVNHNTAVGLNALTVFTGSGATAVGSGAADAATSALYLTAVGKDALGACTDSAGCTAVGQDALGLLEGGADWNTAVGRSAGNGITGDRNTLLGHFAGIYATSTDDSIAIGYGALSGVANYGIASANSTRPTGNSNIAIGSYALDAITTGNRNVAIGHNAASALDGESYNVAIGYNALETDAASSGTVAIGYYALSDQNTASSNNVAIGFSAAEKLNGGTDSVYVGYQAGGVGVITGDFNTVVGRGAAIEATSAEYSTFLGYNSGGKTTAAGRAAALSGASNTCVGSATGWALTSGSSNVLIGRDAGINLTNATDTIAIGHGALDAANLGENFNIAIWTNALGAETSGADGCVAIGHAALLTQNRDGSRNTAIGYVALTNLGSGVTYGGLRNTALGYQAGGGGVFGGGSNGDGDDNTLIGGNAGFAITTGTDNVSIGSGSGESMTTGLSNVLIGMQAGYNITTAQNNVVIGKGAWATGVGVASGGAAGQYNVVVGGGAGNDLTSGHSNILMGYEAGANFTDNSYNVAIGTYALDGCNGGEAGNIAIGYGTLSADIAGSDYCIAIGHGALGAQNADVKNTAIGGLAGDAITGGGGNTLLGYQAGSGIVDGGNNTAVGHTAYLSGTGSNNTMIGADAGESATGDNNVCIGSSAGTALLGGTANVLIGKSAGVAMTTGDHNVAIGMEAALAMVGESDQNVAIGYRTLKTEASGADSCIAIGNSALLTQNAAAAINLAIGQAAGSTITTGTKNVLIGHEAGSLLAATATDTGDNCTAVGYNALKTATGARNTAFGSSAAALLDSGINNVAVGTFTLDAADGGESDNTAIGYAALTELDDDDGDNNVAIGYSAGRYHDTGSGNTALVAAQKCVFIGDTAKASSGWNTANRAVNQIAIGYNALAIGNNTIALGDTNITAIKGQVDFAAYSDRRIKRDIKNDDTGLALIEKLQPVTYKFLNSADYPDEIAVSVYKESTREELVSPAVEAAEAVYETVVVQEARDAVAEETREEVHPAIEEVTEEVTIPAVEAVYEDRVVVHAEAERTETRITQEAREEITSTRHKHTEVEVTETVTGEEIVEVDGKWVKRATSEEVTRTERTPLYDECDLYNEDGSICTHCVTPAVEAVAAVEGVEAVEAVEAVAATYYEEGDELPEGVSVGDEKAAAIEAVEAVAYVEAVEAVEAVAEVRANDIHRVAVMEEYISQTAQEEVTETIVTPAVEEVTERVLVSEATEERNETRVVVEAKDEWTETHITRPAEAAVEEVTERRLVSAAVEAKDAVYETVTVPADDRPADDDTVRLGLIAQDVQTAMTEAGVEFDIVNESPNGKLSLKYGNLVMPLIKAVQELSARVKTLEG